MAELEQELAALESDREWRLVEQLAEIEEQLRVAEERRDELGRAAAERRRELDRAEEATEAARTTRREAEQAAEAARARAAQAGAELATVDRLLEASAPAATGS